MRKFAFLVHPRNILDVKRRIQIARILPSKMVERMLLKRKSGIVCSQFDVFGEAKGYIVGVPLTAKQIKVLFRTARQKILEAVLFAQYKLGVKRIGLGALTASVTKGGKWIAQNPEVQVSITHGNTYTVAVAEEGIEKMIDFSNTDREKVKIAIVGATGIIGGALTEIFDQKGYHLILVGKSRVRLDSLKRRLINERDAIISIELEDIYDADIVITATSHPDALIQPDYLKEGAMLYDIAQPSNVSPNVVRDRPDILRIDGGYVSVNGIKVGFDMGPPSGVTFACLAETMMEVFESVDNHVGKIDLTHVQKTRFWAEKYGFSHAPFSCFNKLIPFERFQEISELNKNNKLLIGKSKRVRVIMPRLRQKLVPS